VLKVFPITNAKLAVTPSSQSSNPFPYPGTTPSISANGIVWAVENGNTAVLHAYDATNLASELYNSNQAANSRDQFAGNKFITPMVAKWKSLCWHAQQRDRVRLTALATSSEFEIRRSEHALEEIECQRSDPVAKRFTVTAARITKTAPSENSSPFIVAVEPRALSMVIGTGMNPLRSDGVLAIAVEGLVARCA
jgi:hypothetical protein